MVGFCWTIACFVSSLFIVLCNGNYSNIHINSIEWNWQLVQHKWQNQGKSTVFRQECAGAAGQYRACSFHWQNNYLKYTGTCCNNHLTKSLAALKFSYSAGSFLPSRYSL